MNAELIEEQRRLQLEAPTPTDRSRTLRDYTGEFFNYFYSRANETLDDRSWTSDGLGKMLEEIVRVKGHAVWVDLGCGNGIALRQGKEYFDRKGIDPGKLHAYGFDVLPMDDEVIRRHIRDFPKDFSGGELNKKYLPMFEQLDIASVEFPEKPDIVTAVESLFWTRDPLKVFANAAEQADVGSIFMFTRLNHLGYRPKDDGDCSCHYLFDALHPRGKSIPGFECMETCLRSLCENPMMIKISDLKDFTYGMKLCHSRPWMRPDNQNRGVTQQQGFWYTYTSRTKRTRDRIEARLKKRFG